MSQFDEVIPRLNTNSEKWDGAEALFGRKDIIPMWVADMDFRAPKPVLDAFRKRVDHGVFGYTKCEDGMTKAILNWNKTRHGFDVDSDAILYNAAVVPSISLAIRALTKPSEKVLMHSPIYPPFFKVTGDETKREVVLSPLKHTGTRFEIDFADMEQKLAQNDIQLFLLCNPQNPGGISWKKEELTQLVELCARYNVPIVSDEIHADLVMKNHVHTPLVKVAPYYKEQIITLMAPTKTFNLAALKVSYLIIDNPDYRAKFRELQQYVHAPGINEFGQIALEAAYNEGAEWLDELRDYIYENFQYVKAELNTHCPEIGVTELEATYLMWLDARALKKDEATLYQDIIDAGCGVQMGSGFGAVADKFIRLNIACPRETLKKGVAALIAGIQK
ncbi:MalY/PatB family protein [Listeria sp. ILCC797]|uniref:MalY/PatB family protein n=1 Tax=Listeria sp. ILCC797 TaxID=1918333 RepID=UPI000B58D796|nr:MalY/PatB family protein [Listeria sp. ILCC797]